MKEFYNKYFHIPTDGNISEKVMLMRVVITVVFIVFCLFAMCLSAYAFFSHNVNAGSLFIKSADFNVTVTVNSETRDDNIYQLENGEYSVVLTKFGSASTGFCIIEITIGEVTTKYYTQQLGADGESQRTELRFTLNLTGLSDSEMAVVKFTPHWGTSHYYGYGNASEMECYIQNEASVNVSAETNIDVSVDSDNEENNTTPSDSVTPTEIIYVIQSGDTLSIIAEKFGVTLEQILACNDFENPNIIYEGEIVKIPLID